MKKILCLATLALTILGFYGLTAKNKVRQKLEQLKEVTLIGDKVLQADSSKSPKYLFTLSDAEKILGEPAHLADSVTTFKGDVFTYSCAFKANAKDLKTGKTGAVYFLIEQFALDSFAKKKYDSIKKANEKHKGIKVLHDLGDEAYFHSDRQNFYFIMVRKAEKVFNMKVNKITSATSLEEFNLITKKITAEL